MENKPEITTIDDEMRVGYDPAKPHTGRKDNESDIIDLLDNIFTALELGWDIEKVRQTTKTQERLGRVSATFDELVEIATHIKETYCVDCPLRYE